MARGGPGHRLRMSVREQREAQKHLLRLTLSIFVFMVFLSLFYSSFTRETLPSITTSEEYWEVVASDDKVLMFFAQAACLGCKKLEPYIQRLSAERGDEISVYKVDLDAIASNEGFEGMLSFVGEVGVRATPTLIVYVNGVEVARHEGTFGFGDQWEPLLSFVEAALEGRPEQFQVSVSQGITTSLGVAARTTSPLEAVATLLAAFALGLVAAVSPCSLPMLAAFASISEESKRFKSYLTTLVMIVSVSFAAGSLLALLYAFSGLFPLINPLVLVLYAGSAFIVAWGLMSLAGRDPVIALPRARVLLPLLGLQCSLPFLVAMIALAGKAPHLVFGASLMFAAGYGLPYALAGALGGGLISKVISLAGTRTLHIAQGVVLIAAGLYIYWNTIGGLLS